MGKSLKTTKTSFGVFSLVLSVITTLSFFFLSATSTSATNTAVSDIDITVPVSCNIITTLDSPHTATINPGQSVENIGTTTFNIFCNDTSGYSLYAIGYSGEEYGNTNMLATIGGTPSPTNNFPTGTATSGATSNWSMKLTAVSGTYAPTILNGFNVYHDVPSTYTKVATFTSSTDYDTGSSLQSTYKGYISSSQPSGTYNGKVKYTIVHPNNADAPTLPVACDSGKICYNPNASGVTDSMGDQSIGPNVALWVSNFQRPGYGFAGWSDKNDWALNINDINGNGVNENENYHIYGPNQTVTLTTSNYSGSNPGLSLYAVWVPSAGNLQGWTGCSGLSKGQITALTDTRDNNTYAVAKLADGKCWMIENLRLADQTLSGTTITLTTTNTHNPLNDGTNVNLNLNGGGTGSHLSASVTPSSNTPWCTVADAACYDKSMLFSGNTTNPASVMTASNNTTNVYYHGNYYNWYSATAGKGTRSFNTNNNSVDGDLCPSGWRLPQGGNKTRITSNDDNDFWNLIVDELNGGALSANYDSAIQPFYTGSTETNPVYKKIKSYPNNFVNSGYVYGSSVDNRGSYGYYWSSTTSGSVSAYRLTFGSTLVYPGTGEYSKYYGYSVRCVAGS